MSTLRPDQTTTRRPSHGRSAPAPHHERTASRSRPAASESDVAPPPAPSAAAPTPPSEQPPRQITQAELPPLPRNVFFRLFWLGEGVSILGNATTTVLLPIIAVLLFNAGAGWMGTIAAANWLPWLVLGLPAGAWVDRLDKRHVMITSDLVAAAVMASVPIAWAFGGLTLYHLVFAALVNGTCSVFFKASFPGFVTRIVRREDLDHANSRIFGIESVMHVAGPGIGGLIARWAAGVLGLLIDVASYLVSAFCLWKIDPAKIAHDASAQRRPSSLREDVLEGLGVVWRDRFLRFFTLQGAASNFGLTGFQALVALYFVRDLGLDTTLVGVLLMCGSLGSIVGALLTPRLVARLGSGRAAVVLQLIAGPIALVLPFSSGGLMLVVACLAYAAVGAGVVGGNVIRSSFRQKYVAPEVLGRTVTTSFVVNYGSMPLAGLAVGVLGETIGLQSTVLIMLSIHVVAALSILISPVARHRVLPTRDSMAAAA